MEPSRRGGVFVDRSMSDEDRNLAIDLILELESAADAGTVWSFAMDALANGVRGIREYSDEELLDSIEESRDFLVRCGALDDLEDAGQDPALRLWSKYRRPELICGKCGGSGKSTVEGYVKCQKCGGTGVGDMFLIKEAQNDQDDGGNDSRGSPDSDTHQDAQLD